MMLPTHALIGLALALPLAAIAPEFAGVALTAGLLGGILPDLDMYVGHRKTLHYPVYYSVLAVAVAPFAVLVPTTVTIAATFLLLGAAVHSVMDIFGGGLELRPWEATSSRAVYDHRRGRWLAPRRWIRYDGAPEDLLLSLAIAVPLLIALDGVLRLVVGAALVIAVVYTAVRRLLPTIAEVLVAGYLVRTLSDRLLAVLPARYGPERGK
ncbi:metal-dependent hydrolase [Natrinema sp. DC36]|uniref:metal-dependent hydrolase n=1 Tax=Natrinema sp. DC36 TaxID=2878680 RepID=UPI001CF0C901|nr:metal-dependent hydrolase [Natrinema sp. DC36]